MCVFLVYHRKVDFYILHVAVFHLYVLLYNLTLSSQITVFVSDFSAVHRSLQTNCRAVYKYYNNSIHTDHLLGILSCQGSDYSTICKLKDTRLTSIKMI